MEANAGMVAGSYRRNELVRIRHDSDSAVCLLYFKLFFFSFMFSGFDLFWLHFCVFVWIRVLNFAIVNFFGWGFVNF
jgi:hypothetical protein